MKLNTEEIELQQALRALPEQFLLVLSDEILALTETDGMLSCAKRKWPQLNFQFHLEIIHAEVPTIFIFYAPTPQEKQVLLSLPPKNRLETQFHQLLRQL